jgi:putative DNA primase/helicase
MQPPGVTASGLCAWAIPGWCLRWPAPLPGRCCALQAWRAGAFTFRGDSSSGKTTALRLAASVYGGPSYMQRWRTTDNALEAIAAQHCDSLLILDELAQVEGKVAGECAYMLANEQSKARATRNGAPRARLSWRLLFLSAGELGLADHMAEGMKRTRTGQEVRMADIPADAGAGWVPLRTCTASRAVLPFQPPDPRKRKRCHGAPGRAWLHGPVPMPTPGRRTHAQRSQHTGAVSDPQGLHRAG